ncbi:MAG: ATP-grasp domain-containing protein [Desulfobacteraceae bacterium]|nr:ATP-grasp domain-containing protein [Desulfobacteraceae bacterium]
MNVVFLSPHFPAQYYQFCKQLKEAGANALGLADARWEELTPAMRDSLTEYFRVEDMNQYDQLVRALGYFTHKYGKIDRLDSLNEHWLETEARLRDDFNIFGVSGNTIGHIRRKSLMKERYRAAGVPVARGQVVHTLDQARALIAQTGYPVVAKPDAGVGALNTYRLNNEKELAEFFRNKPAVDYIMEEFVAGDIFSFDGLTDKEGRIVFYTAHAYSQGIMETVNEARHVSYHSLREIPAALEAHGRNCVKSFDVRERFFHMEFFQTAPDQYVALEVNMRPPGGYTTDMFNYACDIDIYRIWAQLLVQGRNKIDFTRKYHCCYASRKHSLPYRYTHEEILARYGERMVQIVSVPGVFASALGDIGYIFRSPDIGVIREMTSYIHAVG